jgi:hypothetical protein
MTLVSRQTLQMFLISYSHVDTASARQIAATLDERRFPAFLDENVVNSGDSIVDTGARERGNNGGQS